MLFDSALHFRSEDFPWKCWQSLAEDFHALGENDPSPTVSVEVPKQWRILHKRSAIKITLVHGPHGGERFHWKVMLTSEGGNFLHDAWLRYAIPFEAMSRMDCVFSDYTTEEIQATQEGLLSFAKTKLFKAFTISDLEEAGYLTESGQLILSSRAFSDSN